MPHVSKHKLDPKLQRKILSKLVKTFIHAKDHKTLTYLLDELLTSTEKTMLAKRLAIIMMLSGQTPQHRIAEILKVSPTTVSKLSLDIESGQFKTILNMSRKEKIDLEKILWVLLTAGGIMPPRVGGKYWKKYKNS